MTIVSLIPYDILELLREIEALGFSLCLVGGAPRDFFRQKTLSADLDFEIRNQEVSVLRSFFKDKNIEFTQLPYDITRIEFQSFDLEFSIPRFERPIKGNLTHHHFEAFLSSSLSYKESFKRRDFTINAIGIELDISNNKEMIIDPYEGLQDLNKGILREVSDDFYLDSVRFLRLIRFSIKYGFFVSDSIKNRMSEFTLNELSKHHFIEEMRKSLDAGCFINTFNKMVKDNDLSIPIEFKFWNDLKLSLGLKTKDDVLVDVFLQSEEKAKSVILFFSMSEKRLRDLKSFYDSYKKLQSTSKEELKTIVAVPVNEIKSPGLLKDLKNLEEKKEWRSYFNESLPISWIDWEGVTVTASELENAPIEIRSYMRYYKTLKKSLKE